MRTYKTALIICALCVTAATCYAQDLLSKEAVTYFNEGVKAQKAGNYIAANTAYQKFLLLYPYDMNYRKIVLNNCGICFARQGNFAMAESAFQAALEIDPNYQSPKLNLGLVYDMQDTRKAKEYWMKLLEDFKPKQFVIDELPQPAKGEEGKK